MKRYVYFLGAMLLIASRVDAHCEKQEYGKYQCVGGTLEDINIISNNATKISIFQMDVDHINGTVLSRFAKTLKWLEFSFCPKLIRVDENAFSKLTKLIILNVIETGLTKVKAVWFKSTVALKILKLVGEKIDNIDKNAFSNLRNLTAFMLYGTKVRELRNQWFPDSAVPLSAFSLRNNNFDNIEDNFFGRFKDLRILDLGNNSLSTVKIEWFGEQRTIPLTTLLLDNNKISDLDDLIIRGTNLVSLYVPNNQLQCQGIKNIISGSTVLKNLYIRGNDYEECREKLKRMARARRIRIRM